MICAGLEELLKYASAQRNNLYNIQVTTETICKKMFQLNSNKSFGPDEVDLILLIELVDYYLSLYSF